MTEFNRKPVFDAVRTMLGPLDQVQVGQLDRAIDAGLGLLAPVRPQIGLADSDFVYAARSLSCTVAQIRAVWDVESGGGWFKDVRADILAADGPGGFIDGPHLPKILFEAHIFDRETGGRFRASHPNISSRTWNRKLYVGGQGEWLRLHQAMLLDRRAALRSASVGGAQIMGFNHQLAGFDTVEAFWDAMKTSERAHLDAFVAFIRNRGLVSALRAISNRHADCIAFAKGYNGSGFAANEYHIKIARAHAKYAGTSS
ncbi:MAG: N-acetylmuramidase family protein [Pseudomonadota bacterium]